jgi:hypothetical protein
LDSLLASNANQNYGKNRPRKISEKPSTKEAILWVAEWHLYWQRCHLIDKDGTCLILHYNKVMSKLRDHGLSQEQFENVQRAMINQEEHVTSKDKHTAFEFKIEWLEEWIFEACVDKDDLWKQLEKMKMNKGSKNQSLAAMFSDCLEEVEETFNSKTVFKVFLPHETSTEAVDSHTKNLNTYLALIEFAKRMNISSGQVDYKVKKFIKSFLTDDFGKFNTSTFMKKLKDWGKYTNDRKNGPKEQLNVNAANARREAHTEKLKKAIAEGKCLHCQMEDCLTQRKA